MKRTKKLCLSVISTAFLLGLYTCFVAPLNVSASTTVSQNTNQQNISATNNNITVNSGNSTSSTQNTSAKQSTSDVAVQSVAATPQTVSLATPRITVTAGYLSATVTWKAVSGASKYKISCSDGQTVTYKKAGTHTFSNLREGKIYTFTVVTSATNAKSSSKKLSVSIPVTISENVTGLSVYASNNCLNLKWNTVYGANGYSVYIKKGTSYALLGNTRLTNFQTSIKSGSAKITFMVKPYTTINGTNYSDASGAFVSCVPDTLVSPLKTVRTMSYFCKTTKKVSLYRSWTSKKVIKTLNRGVTVDLTARNSKYKRSKIIYQGRTYYLTTGNLQAFKCNYTTAKYSTSQKLAYVKNYSSKTNYLIWVSHYTQQVNIFQGKKGNWKLIKTFPCATGKYNTRSPRGTFRIGQKENGWYYINTYEEYITHYYGRNAFHTRVHRYPSGSSQNHHKFPIASNVYADATIGKPVSNGCVRLIDSDAYYIWKYMPANTTVISY